MTRLLPAERAALVKAKVDADALERGLLRGAARSAAFTLLSQLRQGEHAPRLDRSPDHEALAAAFAVRSLADEFRDDCFRKLPQRAIPGMNSARMRAGAR